MEPNEDRGRFLVSTSKDGEPSPVSTFRAAKRDLGIPRSQQPIRVLQNINRRGKVVPGRVYDFGGGKYIRDDVIGHVFSNGQRLVRHFNTPMKGHYFY